MKDIYRELGQVIRAKRLSRGLTLEELGGISGMHAAYIGQIERNTKKPSLEAVGILAKALEVPVAKLFAVAVEKKGDGFKDQLGPLLSSVSGEKRKLILDVVRLLTKGMRGIS